MYGLSSLHGELTIDGDTATIRYINVEEEDLGSEEDCIVLDVSSETPLLRYVSSNSGQNYTQYLPTRFTRVPEDEAGQAMYARPLFTKEIIISPLDGKPAEDLATIGSYMTDDPTYISDLRGVRLGDSLMSVLSRFMCEPEKLAVIEQAYDGSEYAIVYGVATYWAELGLLTIRMDYLFQ